MRNITIPIIYLLTIFLVNACTSNVQTVEGSRNLRQTGIAVNDTPPIATPYPAPSPNNPYLPEMTSTPTWIPTVAETPFIKLTQSSPPLTTQQVADKIAACYDLASGGGPSNPLQNNSIQQVVETNRMFINVPKDLYPKELLRYATTINGQARLGWISNGGLPGEAIAGSPGCWSTYVELDGQGEVDLKIPSILEGVPDYVLQFIVVSSSISP